MHFKIQIKEKLRKDVFKKMANNTPDKLVIQNILIGPLSSMSFLYLSNVTSDLKWKIVPKIKKNTNIQHHA